MRRGKLSFTIGCPRSGKSTFGQKWVVEESDRPRVVVNSDLIRLALHGDRFNSLAESMVHAIKQVSIRALINGGHDVLSDDTHTSWSSIRYLLEIDNQATPIWVPEIDKVGGDDWVDLIGLFKERAFNTGQPDLFTVIDRVAKQMVDLKKDFWAILETHRASVRTKPAKVPA